MNRNKRYEIGDTATFIRMYRGTGADRVRLPLREWHEVSGTVVGITETTALVELPNGDAVTINR